MTNEIPILFGSAVATTNSIATTNAVPSLTSPTSSNTSLAGPVTAAIVFGIGVILVVGIGIFVVRKIKGATAAFENSVKDELIEDVLNAVAKGVSDVTALRAELVAAVEGKGVLRTDPLASIRRIEESYEKMLSGRFLRRISILCRKTGSTNALIKVESEIGWEYVPDAVRAKFVETRENKVVRLVYDIERNPST